MSQQPNIFAIYTLEDIAVMHQITQRLKPFGRNIELSIWNDDPVKPGQVWKPQIESRLHKTDVFLLFISNTFMHSEFVKQLEFKMVIDRYKEGKSKVIPILIDDCPWNIDFEADEYTFSFKELQVLPEGGKPLKTWGSSEKVYNAIARSINAMNESFFGNDSQQESKVDKEERAGTVAAEEQMALAFDEEKEAEEEKRRKAETETKRIAAEKRAREEAEAKKKAEEEQRRMEEAVSRKRTAEQREREAAHSRRLEEQKRLKKEAALKSQAEEAQRIEGENRQESVAAVNKLSKETSKENGPGLKKRLLIGLGAAMLAIIGIWAFTRSPDEVAIKPSVSTKAVKVEDAISVEKTEIGTIVEQESLPKLAVGDRYLGGLIFSIDSNGKTGKIVHIDDAGPMPWLDAMIIHDQLGKGWRLPTLDELRLLYSTLGQGASNSAEFANQLYWSATLYDDYQARLLQFRTGNTSYHYNKEAEHRKFLVRAVQDFSR